MSPPSDRTARVVRVGARVADFVLRKKRVVDRIADVLGQKLVDDALDELDDVIAQKLDAPTRRKETPP